MLKKILDWFSYKTPTIQPQERLSNPIDSLIAEIDQLAKVEGLAEKIKAPDAKLLSVHMHTGNMVNLSGISRTIFYKYDLPAAYDCITKTPVLMGLGRYMSNNTFFYDVDKALNDMLIVLKSYKEKPILSFKEKMTLADIATLVGAMKYLAYF